MISDNEQGGAPRSPSLLWFLQCQQKPSAYVEKDVEMAGNALEYGHLQEYCPSIISWEEFYSFVLKPSGYLFISDPEELAYDGELFEVLNKINGGHGYISVSELLVAGHSPAVTQYSVRKRVSPTHAYLTLASSGKSFTEQSAASSLANCGQASSAPMDSENRNSPVEKQGKDSAEDVSTNVTFRPQRANKSAEARIKAAFTEVSGSSGTMSKAQWHAFIAALRIQRVSHVQQKMLLTRCCFYGLGSELLMETTPSNVKPDTSNCCCALDRCWFLDFWYYAMHHHPLLQLAQVATPTPAVPTTFIFIPWWHRVLDFACFSCITLLAAVLLLLYGNLAAHQLNNALGLEKNEEADMTADDHGSVYSSPTSGSSSDSAAQTIAFGLKLFFVSLPAMGQHALNIHSWEHSCLNRICQQKQKLSVSNSPQAQWNALSYLSQALDEMGPIVYTFAISISCFVGSIAIWLAYGSFEDAPAEYWYELLSFFPQTWVFWFVYTACVQFNPSPCAVAVLTFNGHLCYLGIGQWQRERRQVYAAVHQLMAKRGTGHIVMSESSSDRNIRHDNNGSPKSNEEEFKNDSDLEGGYVENGGDLKSATGQDRPLAARETIATTAAIAAAEARAEAAERSATTATSQLDAIMLECNELNLSLSKEVAVRAALEDEVEALRRVVRGALGSSGAPDGVSDGIIEDNTRLEDEGSDDINSSAVSPDNSIKDSTVTVAPTEMSIVNTTPSSSLSPGPSLLRRSSSASSSSSQQPLETAQSVAADSLIRLYAERTRWVAAQADVTAGQERRTQRLLAKRLAAERAAATSADTAGTLQSEPREQYLSNANMHESSDFATAAAGLVPDLPAMTQEAPDVKKIDSVHAETQTEAPLPPIPVPATAAGTQTDELVPAMPKEAEPPTLPALPVVDTNTVAEFVPKPVLPQVQEANLRRALEAIFHDTTTLMPQLNNSSAATTDSVASWDVTSGVDSTEQVIESLLEEQTSVAAAPIDAAANAAAFATHASATATAIAAVAEESFIDDDNKPETDSLNFGIEAVMPSSEGDHKPPSAPIDRGHISHEHLQESEPHTVPMTTQSAVKRALAARNAHKHLVLKHSSSFRHSSHGHKSLGVDNSYCHSTAPPSPFSFEGGALGRLAWTPSIMQPALATSPTHHRSTEGLPRASRTWRSEESARSPERKWPIASTADTPNRRSMPSPLSRNARVGIAPF